MMMQYSVDVCLSKMRCVLVQERNREAHAIAAEAQELHGMVKDFAVLVNEQSKQLDVVEAQVCQWIRAPPCCLCI